MIVYLLHTCKPHFYIPCGHLEAHGLAESCTHALQIEAVVRRIKRITSTDATSKVLVFSTWQDVLEVIAHALRSNRLPFAYARGRKGMEAAISGFKAAAPQSTGPGNARSGGLQTLLLLVKQGGNGLNLTGANNTSALRHISRSLWLGALLVYLTLQLPAMGLAVHSLLVETDKSQALLVLCSTTLMMRACRLCLAVLRRLLPGSSVSCLAARQAHNQWHGAQRLSTSFWWSPCWTRLWRRRWWGACIASARRGPP